MDKWYYFVFSGMDLDIWLWEWGIIEFCLIGVCIDICVLYMVVDVYNLGY